MSVDYVLTTKQAVECAIAARARHDENVKLGRQNRFKADAAGMSLQMHLSGIYPEFVGCLHLHVPFKGKGEFRGPDITPTDEARGRDSGFGGHLFLHPDDRDDARYWFISGIFPRFRVHGYLLGREGKLEKYWGEMVKGKPAFNVHCSKLVVATPEDYLLVHERAA